MTIYTWSGFSKRRNSTKQPSVTGTAVTVLLKEGTSIEKPTFVLSSNDFTINYVQAFGHYYFVDDVKSVRNGIIEISCSMDHGATYKSDIGSYTAFVERSATYANTFLPDPEVAIINDEIVTTDNSYTPMPGFNAQGFFVISVLNDLGSGAGFTTYYIMTASEIEQLAQYINTDWGSAVAPTEIVKWLQATFLKTADSVIDCIWLPLSIGDIPVGVTSLETVKIGVDDITGLTALRITDLCIFSEYADVVIPHYYNDFRMGAPYTRCTLYIPGYGMVEINPLDFSSGVVSIHMDIDVTTGDTIAFLKDFAGNVISTYTFNIGVSCPVGKVGANVTQTVGGLISTAGSVASAIASSGASAAASGATAIASGINTAANAVAPTASVHGGKGGRAIGANGLAPIITTYCKATADPDDLQATHGKPFMADGLLSAFSGYVKCSGADVPIAGVESDKRAVNDLLNGGFYYE